MKKFAYCLLLSCILTPAFADNTNYTNSMECRNATRDYSQQAFERNQVELAEWFTSFALDVEAHYYFNSNTVTIYEGCGYIVPNDSEGRQLWLKIQPKLNKQIEQLKSGQPSLYGSRASLVCKFDTKKDRIDINSCQ